MSSTVRPVDNEMRFKKSSFGRRLKKAKTDILVAFFTKYRKCVAQLKKYLCDEDSVRVDRERRRSHAKLQPLPDRPIRRVVTAKMHRNPSTELERLRRKGDNWTANDLFRFQYGDPEEGEPEERKALCLEWLARLHAISKKYCYLAWYASAIYACYYRLAPLLADAEEKKKTWEEATREYAEMFLMGRRIWRRPTHPSRLHVFYDLAMLCVRFADLQEDPTIRLFRAELDSSTNFDFKLLDEIAFANSIDKVVRLENHVIGLFYIRRRSTCSSRSSFRSRRSTMTMDHSPNRAGGGASGGEATDDEQQPTCSRKSSLALPTHAPPTLVKQRSISEEEDVSEVEEKERNRTGMSSERDIPAKAAVALARLSIKERATDQDNSAPPSPTHRHIIPTIIVDSVPTPSSTLTGNFLRIASLVAARPASPKQTVRFASEQKEKQ